MADAPLLLVTSSGGHLTNLLALRGAWEGWREVWVVRDALDSRTRLGGEEVVWIERDADRNHVGNLGGALVKAWTALGRIRPSRLITVGAGMAVPWVLAAKARGIPTLYIELFGRVERPTVSARICRFFGTRVFVQHRALLPLLPGSSCEGTLW